MRVTTWIWSGSAAEKRGIDHAARDSGSHLVGEHYIGAGWLLAGRRRASSRAAAGDEKMARMFLSLSRGGAWGAAPARGQVVPCGLPLARGQALGGSGTRWPLQLPTWQLVGTHA